MEQQKTLAQCPYYRRDGRQSVHCEGVREGCGLRLAFREHAEKNTFMDTHCRKDWPACPVADMLNRMYDYTP